MRQTLIILQNETMFSAANLSDTPRQVLSEIKNNAVFCCETEAKKKHLEVTGPR